MKPILEQINAPRLPNGRYQKLQPRTLTDRRQCVCSCPTTSSTENAATWISEPDATSTSPIMNSLITTHSSSDLATLIYSTLNLDLLKSNINRELNFHKHRFRKSVDLQLISFCDNTLSAQPHSYKSLVSLIFSALRFLNFNKFRFKINVYNSHLDLGLDSDYDKQEQKETEFQKRLKIFKFKYAQ